MGMVSWEDGRVSTRDSVEVAAPLSGARLRDSYVKGVQRVTLGLVRVRSNSIVLGPVELLRFGKPSVTRTAVEWPIEGGLLAGAPGGRWRLQSSGGRVEATITGYRPRLARPLYAISHMQVHLLVTRLFLIGLPGRNVTRAVAAAPPDRIRAATVDAAFCLTLTRLTGRRNLRRLIAVAAVYHVVCWSTSGQTLGGLVMRQRVVSVNGSRPVLGQSLLRLALLPLSWIAWRPLHDTIAGTTVINT